MNFYGILADLVVAVHVVYVSTVVVGMLLILLGGVLRWQWVRNFWFRMLHLLLIAIVVFEALLGITCPLTNWEYDLREKAGQTVENGSFIGRILHDMIFTDVSPTILTICYCLFGLLVFLALWFIPPKLPKCFSKADRQSFHS